MKTHLLIVDDDHGVSRSLLLILRRMGYEVTTAATGEKALAIAATQTLNLVLLDIKLPDTIGTDLIRPLHELQPDLEIVIATAHATLETAVRALNQGAAAYIHKPIDIDELLNTIDRVLEKQKLKWENERLVRELQREKALLRRRARELDLLNQVITATVSQNSQEEMLEAVCDRIAGLFAVPYVSVGLIEANETQYTPACVYRRDREVAETFASINVAGHPVLQTIFKMGRPYQVEDLSAADLSALQELLPPRQKNGALLIVPITMRGDAIIGALHLIYRRPHTFTAGEVRMAQLVGEEIGRGLETVRLYEQLRRHAAELEERVARRTEELSIANAKLVQAMRAKDEFLASMSHELRTPLNAILLREEILREQSRDRLDQKQMRSLDIIRESGDHLLALINDILDVAKVEAGKLDLSIGPLSVRAVCESSLRLVHPMASKKQIEVASDLDEEAGMMWADGRRLKQVLVNLLSNAVKFTDEGGRVGLMVEGDREEDVIHFTVWDTGIGIAREDMEQLFEPFVQLDSSLSRHYGGTGLGLALAQRVVELHDGGLRVESEVGEGSRFTVSLPWPAEQRQRQRGAESSNGSQPRIDAGMLVPPGSQRPKLLLAEDNPITIETLVEYLQTHDYRVIVAATGVEAVAQTHRTQPDLILMGIQLPGIDGLEAIRRIRADESISHIPIVALTALAMPGDEERCLAAGADLYLSKPIRLRRLLHTLTKLLPRPPYTVEAKRM